MDSCYPSNSFYANMMANKYNTIYANEMMSTPSMMSGLPCPTPTMMPSWNFPSTSTFNGSNSFNGWPMMNSYERFPWMAAYNNAAPMAEAMCNVAFRPTSELEFQCLTNPIRVLDREGNRMVWLCYEMRAFKPEEITVTLNKTERSIVVEASHEIKEGKEHQVTRKFSRKFCFPATLSTIDMSKCEIKSCFTAEGLLTVECVLPKMTAEELTRYSTSMASASPMNVADWYFARSYGTPSYRSFVAPIATKTA